MRTTTELYASIEGRPFAFRVNATASFNQARQVIVENKNVADLQARACQQASICNAIANRVRDLCATRTSDNFRSSYDGAIAAYVHILSRANYYGLNALLGKIAVDKSLWWARVMAKNILEAK